MRPKDAATLIILRQDGPHPKFMMGKRHENSKFMPGKFVFPGGRVDAGDCRVKPLTNLHPKVEQSLINKMRRTPSPLRARALAMAAIRETFEEVGLIIGKQHNGAFNTRASGWRQFGQTGYGPALDQMRLIARAITPPGRTRRFDARFFVIDASEVANLDSPYSIDNDELLECHWVGFDDILSLDLPWITQKILGVLRQSLKQPGSLDPGKPAMFHHMTKSGWCQETV
ncbi:MutT/Nudix family protein [hydrothermal vent metagenome]|uniref:MutT/Nudix family protein n=1 Tax=hydrothermal vent metagenome TaxID=652676 RepID=A0A3B0SQ76_9ZZZZ